MHRRDLAVLLFGTALTLSASPLIAQDKWPSGPITYVVSAGPGGSPDVLARIIASHLEKRLGVPVVVENRTGGGGNIAREFVASAPADGNTLFGLSGTESINRLLFPDLPFPPDFFEPVIAAVGSQQVLAFYPPHPVDSVAKLVELAKASPGTISLASPSWGTTGQLGVLYLQEIAGVQFNPVVYKNATAAMPDVVAGHADGILVTLSAALPFIRDGALRAVAVSTPERTATLPDVPTFAESGYPDFAWTDWQGFGVKRGTPPEIVERLNAEVNAILQDPEAAAQLETAGFTLLGGPPSVASEGLVQTYDLWAPIIEQYDIKVN